MGLSQPRYKDLIGPSYATLDLKSAVGPRLVLHWGCYMIPFGECQKGHSQPYAQTVYSLQ